MPKARRIYQSLSPEQRRPSFWRYLPWSGLIALLLAFGCGILALSIGMVSNGRPQNSWTVAGAVVQPSVLLSLSATIANACLRIAFAEGAIILWWLQAHQGASFEKLSASYEHAQTSRNLFSSFSHPSSVSLAGLAMLLLLADGPLLQKASSIVVTPHTNIQNLNVPVSRSPLTYGATAIMTTHDVSSPSIYTAAFAQVAQDYGARNPISIPDVRYPGIIYTNLTGPGWDISCRNESTGYTLMSNSDWMEFNTHKTYSGPPSSQTMFQTTVDYERYIVSSGANALLYQVQVDSFFKSTLGDNGTLEIRQCNLSEAIVRYPVLIENGTVFLQDMPLNENRTEYLVRREYESNGWIRSPSTLGGFWLALSNQFDTAANLTQKGGGANFEIELVNTNSIASQFVVGSDFFSYNISWTDPIATILAAANELAFRAAIRLTNATTSPWDWINSTSAQPEVLQPNLTFVNRSLSQEVTAMIVTSGPTYQTHIGWLLGGFAIIAFACLANVPLYWGWWRLGRRFTLNPLETARAFDAPLLQSVSGNSPPGKWPTELRHLQIRYGIEVTKDADGGLAGGSGIEMRTLTAAQQGGRTTGTTKTFAGSVAEVGTSEPRGNDRKHFHLL